MYLLISMYGSLFHLYSYLLLFSLFTYKQHPLWWSSIYLPHMFWMFFCICAFRTLSLEHLSVCLPYIYPCLPGCQAVQLFSFWSDIIWICLFLLFFVPVDLLSVCCLNFLHFSVVLYLFTFTSLLFLYHVVFFPFLYLSCTLSIDQKWSSAL